MLEFDRSLLNSNKETQCLNLKRTSVHIVTCTICHTSHSRSFYTNHLQCAATIWHFKQGCFNQSHFELFNINILHKLRVIFKRLPKCFICKLWGI